VNSLLYSLQAGILVIVELFALKMM